MADATKERKESRKSEARWALVERISTSEQLRRAPRLQELLFYIGKRSLNEGVIRIQEQEIGAKVFGRSEHYDTSIDNIVRTNVSDLRKRVETYFSGEGLHETLVMEIPRGSYVPVFRYRSPGSGVAASIQNEIQVPSLESPERISELQRSSRHQRWVLGGGIVAGLAVIPLAIGCAFFWGQYRALYAWKYEPSVAGLWSQILNADSDTDVVISDASLGLVQALSHRTFSLRDYTSRSYISLLQAEDLSPDMHAALNRILAWNLDNPNEIRLARRILALDPPAKNIHLYDARSYVPDLTKRDNLILIGARRSNPWDELVESRMNFVVEHDSNGLIANRSPGAGEQQTYTSTESADYCVIAYLPNRDHKGIVMLIEGAGAEATEGAGDFLLSEEQLSNFERILHVSKLPYFEVLLKVSSVRGTPLSTTVEAYRAYPYPH